MPGPRQIVKSKLKNQVYKYSYEIDKLIALTSYLQVPKDSLLTVNQLHALLVDKHLDAIFEKVFV